MKINDDIITFDAADFAGLSDFAKKALPPYVGEKLEFQNVFAEALTKLVEDAKTSLTYTTAKTASADSLLRKLAAADARKLADAAPLLAQLDAALA